MTASSCLNLLPDEMTPLVDAALGTLDNVGILVEDEVTRGRLEGAGCTTVDGWTRVPPNLVGHCIESAPRSFSLFDRDGTRACELGVGATFFGPGSAALRVVDLDDGRQRAATLQDCVRLARLVDSLEALAVQSTGLVPADVPAHLADLTRLHIALSECGKPVVTGTFMEESFATMKKMLIAVRGSEEALARMPLAVFDCCPTPPLRWSRLSCRTLSDCASSQIPVNIVSMPIGGATAPVTIPERVIQHVAENLSGLVIHQTARSGAPVLFGGAAATCEMRRGTTPTAGPASIQMGVVCAQVGRFLGLPTQFFLGTSDAKSADWQAGAESAVGLTMAALAGVDLVTGLGMLDFIGCFSLEKLVLDHEAARASLRLTKGPGPLTVESPVSLLGDLSRSGQVLAHAHTRRNFRTALHVPGESMDQGTHADWVDAGREDASSRATAVVRRVTEREPSSLLEFSRLDGLRGLLSAEFSRQGASYPAGL